MELSHTAQQRALPPEEILLSERQQRAIERLLEDERLTSDLTDDQAGPLLQWASLRAIAAADDAMPDDAVEQALRAIRRAIFHAAACATTTPLPPTPPDELVAFAQHHLEQNTTEGNTTHATI